MPFIMGHMTGGWGLGRIAQWITKTRFTHLEWGLLLFGALLPDFDHIYDWTMGVSLHRTFTHSLVFLAVAFIGVYLVSKACRGINGRMDAKRNATMVSFGVTTHLVLDMAIGAPGIALFWPNLSGVYLFGIGPHRVQDVFETVLLGKKGGIAFMLFDMALGAAWMGYFFITKRIRF